MSDAPHDPQEPEPSKTDTMVTEGASGAEVGPDVKQEGAPLVTHEAVIGTAAPAEPKVSIRQRYEERLQGVWKVAHGDASPESEDPLWKAFRKTMARVIEPRILLSDQVVQTIQARAEAASAGAAQAPGPVEGFPGDVSAVDMLVAAAVERLDGLAAAEYFIQEPLAQTLARLEEAGEGTPEQRVDVVLRAVGAFRGTPGAATLALALFRHLQTQPERGPGFFFTVNGLAFLVQAWPTPETLRGALLLLARSLSGTITLVTQDPAQLDRLATEAIFTASGSSAAAAARLIQQDRRELDDTARSLLQDLQAIAAVTARPAPVDDVQARRVAAALGLLLLGSDPASVLRVVSVMGAVSAGWGPHSPDEARLAAYSAVGAAVDGDIDSVAVRLFNAGVALDGSPDGSAPPAVAAQLLLNALGLRWVLDRGDDLASVLLGFHAAGINCAVNFMGTAVQYRDAAPERWSRIEPLVQALGQLPAERGISQEPGHELDLAKVAAAARRLEVRREGAPETTPKSTLEAVKHVINAFAGDAERDGDVVVDTAVLVRHAFVAPGLLAQASWGLEPEVKELVAARAEPLELLRKRAAGLVATEEDPTDGRRFVADGIVSAEQWAALTEALLSPLDAVAPLLRAFSPATEPQLVLPAQGR